MEEIPARANGWMETELKSLMLQVLWLQTDGVRLRVCVCLAKIGGLRYISVITGNMLKIPGAKLGKGKAGL